MGPPVGRCPGVSQQRKHTEQPPGDGEDTLGGPQRARHEQEYQRHVSDLQRVTPLLHIEPVQRHSLSAWLCDAPPAPSVQIWMCDNVNVAQVKRAGGGAARPHGRLSAHMQILLATLRKQLSVKALLPFVFFIFLLYLQSSDLKTRSYSSQPLLSFCT